MPEWTIVLQGRNGAQLISGISVLRSTLNELKSYIGQTWELYT